MTFEISISIFIIALIISKVLSEKALKELPEKKKIELVDKFSNMRIYSILSIFIVLGGLYYAVKNTDINSKQLIYLYYSFPFIYMLITQTYIYKKLLHLDFPQSYIKKFILSQIVIAIGIIILFYDIF